MGQMKIRSQQRQLQSTHLNSIRKSSQKKKERVQQGYLWWQSTCKFTAGKTDAHTGWKITNIRFETSLFTKY